MALARRSTFTFRAHDPVADFEALQRWAGWLERFSPVVGLEDGERPSSLLLDIRGCGRLFGGEEQLLDTLVAGMVRKGRTVRAAIAETVGAAWAVSHYAVAPSSARPSPSATRSSGWGERWVVAPGECGLLLPALPIEALRLPATTLVLLQELGIWRIGPLLDLPRDELTCRFGPELLQRLDQAWGDLPEPILPYRLPPVARADWVFDEPVFQRQALEAVGERLIRELVEELRSRGEGITQLECYYFSAQDVPRQGTIQVYEPTINAAHLAELFRLRLEQEKRLGEIGALRLMVRSSEPLRYRQGNLFAVQQEEAGPHEFGQLVDRLRSRLGRRAIVQPRLIPDAQPEEACRYEPFDERSARYVGRRPPVDGHRPITLLPRPWAIRVVAVVPEGPPIRLDWAGKQYRVRQCWGPERIETGWWRGCPVARDYYQVELERALRWWIFREREQGSWFLHGIFD